MAPALWAGVFAGAMSVVFSAPARSAWPCFVGGLLGRLTRDLLLQAGTTLELASMAAAALVVVASALLTRRAGLSPAVMVSALLPLGAAAAFFRALVGFMQISRLPPAALPQVSVALVANLSRVFMTSLAIALGVAIGLGLVRLLQAGRRTSPQPGGST
ncbi:MAG: threonine/serine exporter family protein [Phenylobacterium sp.]